MSLKNVLLYLLLFILILSGVAGWIYSNAKQPLDRSESKIAGITKEAGLEHPARFHLYHPFKGKETIYVAEGKNKKGEDLIVWIPEKDKKPVIRKAGQGISRNEAINIVKKEKNPEKIMSVRLGMEGSIPFWEIYYSTGNGLMNYYCINFDTGEWYYDIEDL